MKEKEKFVIPLKKMESLNNIEIYTTEKLLEISEIYAKSNLAPSHLKTKEAIFIAMKWAQELNMSPILGIRDIFVIDNIPTLRTEAAIALVENSGISENIELSFEGNPYDDDYTAVCLVKRKGRKQHTSTFSVKDAKTAMLWGKKTVNGKPTAWCTYPKRMLMYRAASFALRDIYPDVLRGASIYEEVLDYTQYEIINDKSNDSEINSEVRKTVLKTVGGMNKLRNIMNDTPPE